jgi:hypothetical protein
MKLIPIAAAALIAAASAPAFSATVNIDFEDQISFDSLNLASAPYGITANSALLGLANDGSGSGSLGEFFSNTPTGGSVVMFATAPLAGQRAEIAITAGSFLNSVSFYYSAAEAGQVDVRDSAGLSLGTFNFVANSTSSTSPFNTWGIGSIAFTGPAYSIDFTGIGNTAIDNVSVSAVPLPAAALLFPLGAAALGASARRKRKA